MAPFRLIVYYPKSKDGRDRLSKQVSQVHASAVIREIGSLNCSASQKSELLERMIESIKKGSDRCV